MDHVTDIGANAKLHSATIFDLCVTSRHRPLNGDGALYGIHDTAELSKDPVAGGVDHTTMVARDHWKYDRQVILQVADGPRLVGRHQRAIAGNVSSDNCRQPAGNLCSFAELRHRKHPIRPLGLPSTSPITLCLTFGQPDWER